MMRVKFSQTQSELFYSEVFLAVTKNKLCQELHISTKTLNDWIRLKHRPPLNSILFISKKYKIEFPSNVETIDTTLEKSPHGKLGALKRYALYGELATREGRIKGGYNSVKSHKALKTSFQLEVIYQIPHKSALLAEFIGIVIGDGHISHSQISIYLNSIDDSDYILYVRRLIHELYSYKASISIHNTKKLASIRLSSTLIVKSMTQHNLLPGNKLANKVSIPDWIIENRKYLISTLRGLFDTDGSIYQDKHTFKSKLYCYINVAYSIYNETLYKQVYELLIKLGFHPTTSTPRNILIRIADEVDLFFSIIQPANKKHLIRYKRFTRRSN